MLHGGLGAPYLPKGEGKFCKPLVLAEVAPPRTGVPLSVVSNQRKILNEFNHGVFLLLFCL